MLKTIASSSLSAVLALFLATAGCGDKPSQGDCEKLLDHLIDMEISEAGTDELTTEMQDDLAKQKQGILEHIKTQFMSQCTDKTPGSYVKCGLKARSLEELAKCDKG